MPLADYNEKNSQRNVNSSPMLELNKLISLNVVEIVHSSSTFKTGQTQEMRYAHIVICKDNDGNPYFIQESTNYFECVSASVGDQVDVVLKEVKEIYGYKKYFANTIERRSASANNYQTPASTNAAGAPDFITTKPVDMRHYQTMENAAAIAAVTAVTSWGFQYQTQFNKQTGETPADILIDEAEKVFRWIMSKEIGADVYEKPTPRNRPNDVYEG